MINSYNVQQQHVLVQLLNHPVFSGITIHYADILNILQSCVIYKYVFLFCCNSWFYVHPRKLT